jgi:hypothetical protein
MKKAEKENSIIDSQIENKVTELEGVHKVKVHPFKFKVGENDFVIGYLKEPTYHIKKQALDISIRSITDASELILNTCLINEESDPRIWSEDAETKHTGIRLGAVMRAQELVTYFSDTLKKK